MRKLLIVVLLLLFVFSLSACSTDEQPSLVDIEYNRIIELIPNEYENDIVLPSISEGFTVVYLLDGVTVSNTIVYDPFEEDEVKELEIVLSNSDETNTYTSTITQIGNAEIYLQNQQNATFDYIFSQIFEQLPDSLLSNLSLPQFREPIVLAYGIDCASIYRDRIVYDFPEETKQCSLEISVSLNGATRIREKSFEMLSISDLPKLPAIYINTSGTEISSKDEYVTATLSTIMSGSDTFSDFVDVPMKIRLRGNSTFDMPKLSYKIKFDEKQPFFSDYEEKDWVLLANFADQTLIRSYLAFYLSDALHMAFTPSYTFVDLYIDNVYQGNYMLTDQIEVTNDRVDIEENIPTIDTGFLFELDKGYDRVEVIEDNMFFVHGMPFVLKSPDIEDSHYLPEQKEFIRYYMDSFIDAIKDGEDYNTYIDVDSFVDWFIVNELFKNVDSGYSSVYFYKDKGGKLEMGPVWDFDLSTGNPGHLESELRVPEGWYTSLSYKNEIFYYLMKYPSFQQKLKSRWNEIYESEIVTLLDELFVVSDSITHSRYYNFLVWDVIGKNEDWYTAEEILERTTYEEQLWFLYDYLKVRMKWLDEEINKF